VAHPHLSTTLARFDAKVHRTKNRLIAIPAELQQRLGLSRRQDNDIVLLSLRKARSGRWNHHYVKLTQDNEFAIPADVSLVQPGDAVEIKIHALYSGTPRSAAAPVARGASLLLALAARDRPGWREDGSTRLDEYLNEELG
jgi:hypothetical protein